MKKTPEIELLKEVYVEDDTISSTTSTSYQTKLLSNTTPLYSGKYNVEIYCETAISLIAQKVFVRLYDGTNIYTESGQSVKDNYNSGQWIPCTGFKNLQLDRNINYTFYLQFRATSGTAYIRRARILIRRTL